MKRKQGGFNKLLNSTLKLFKKLQKIKNQKTNNSQKSKSNLEINSIRMI